MATSILRFGIGDGDDLSVRLRREDGDLYPAYRVDVHRGTYYLGEENTGYEYIVDESGVIVVDEDDEPIIADITAGSQSNEQYLPGGTAATYSTSLLGRSIVDLTSEGWSLPELNMPIRAYGETTGRLSQLPTLLHTETIVTTSVSGVVTATARMNIGEIVVLVDLTTDTDIIISSCTIVGAVISLPDTVVAGNIVSVSYYPSDAFAHMKMMVGAEEHEVLDCYLSNYDTVSFIYQVRDTGEWRETGDADFYPLTSGASSGFLYMTDTEQLISQVRFETQDGGYTSSSGAVVTIPYDGSVFRPLHLFAVVVDDIGNPIPGIRVVWKWAPIVGVDVPVIVDFDVDTDVSYSTTTDYSGRTGIVLGSTFLKDAGTGLTVDGKQIRLYVYNAETNEQLSSDSTILLTRDTVDSRSTSYVYAVASYLYTDSDGRHYQIAAWEEKLSTGEWTRVDNGGETAEFYSLLTSGATKRLSALSNGEYVEDIAFSASFPYTATINDIVLDVGTEVYVEFDSVQSNIVRVE